MTTPNDPKTTVTRYFDAWTHGRVDEAYALLADDLHFGGPSAEYRTRAEFHPGLVGFAAMTRGARVVELLVDGERVAMLYDCDLPEPVGTLRIASFFLVRDGKIARYDTRFDATELGKLLARHARGAPAADAPAAAVASGPRA